MPFESAGSAEQGETEEEQERRLERQRQIEALREALVNLHRFSDSLNEIRGSGDAVRSNPWLVKDACAGIETLLDEDLKKLEDPSSSETAIGGKPYSADRLAFREFESIANRLQERLPSDELASRRDPTQEAETES